MSELRRLRHLPNLLKLDIDANPLESIKTSRLLAIFSAPTLNMIDSTAISLEERQQARIQFDRGEIIVLLLAGSSTDISVSGGHETSNGAVGRSQRERGIEFPATTLSPRAGKGITSLSGYIILSSLLIRTFS